VPANLRISHLQNRSQRAQIQRKNWQGQGNAERKNGKEEKRIEINKERRKTGIKDRRREKETKRKKARHK
jgi:hypothetical protein